VNKGDHLIPGVRDISVGQRPNDTLPHADRTTVRPLSTRRLTGLLGVVIAVGMTEGVLFNAALALALGMAAQSLATRLAVPSIVLLLVLGVSVGPGALGLLQPDVFGAARSDLVGLAVTVILFEGGLGLRWEQLRLQQRPLFMLLTLGAAISLAVGTLAAHILVDLPWPIAALYGALVIVTGPTVVGPLLARLPLDRAVRDLLVSEGVLIDPIGAIVAIVAAEYVLGRSAVWEAGGMVLLRLGVGAVVGAAAGILTTLALRKRWIPDEHRNPAVLAVVLLSAAAASQLSSDAGLMAAVVQGIVMANTRVEELGRLRQFKEELTLLLLAFIFILLAADLPLAEVSGLSWGAALVVAALMWIGRPLAVLACTAGSGLHLAQRLFIAWICPRGVVAASVAGLFSIRLTEAQIAGGPRLEALVFITVALTVTVQGLTAGLVGRLLGIDLPSLRGTIIIGADRFGCLLARLLSERGRPVVLMDLNQLNCRVARRAGLTAYRGDALSIDDLTDAGARYADTVVALTRNQELNTLIAERVRNNFRVERILSVARHASDGTQAVPFPGNFLGLDELNRKLATGDCCLAEYEVATGECVGSRLDGLAYGEGEFALLLERRDHAFVASSDLALATGDRIVCVKMRPGQSPIAETAKLLSESPVEDHASLGAAPRPGEA
jgi:NhaP-type Na+/H+ or K+/H+ antiporter